jgi:glyoxylase-like metal-dependent hydrolase (beta-lactamase superfamily II)
MNDQPDAVTLVDNQGWDPRILVVRCGDLVDVFIVVSKRYVVLVDTLINPQTAAGMLRIAREQLTGGRQLLAVNTHADWDHFWGNQLFAGPDAIHPAPIFASRRSADRFRAPEEGQQFLAEMREHEPGRFDDVRITRPTVLFDDRLLIDGGDLTLELFPTPGHQPDHVAIFIPEIGALLAGDAAESPFPMVHTADGLPLLRASLAHMAALKPNIALYCHAPVTSGPELLQANIAYFDEVERRCRAARAGGAAARPAEAEDVEALVAFPLAEAIPGDINADELPDLYRRGHRTAIRAMLEWLEQS